MYVCHTHVTFHTLFQPASSAQRSIFTSSSGDEGEDSSLPMVNQVPLPPPSTRSVQKSSPTSTSAAGTKTARSAKTALSSPQRAKKTDWTNTRISIFDDGENVGGNSDSSPLTAARTARNGVVMGGASVVGVVRRHTSSSSSSSSSGNSPSSRRRSLVGGMSGLVLDDFAETAELKKVIKKIFVFVCVIGCLFLLMCLLLLLLVER